MDSFKPSHKIYLGRSRIKGAGRGVFAGKDIKKNEVIEYCPVIEMPARDLPNLKKTLLHNYYFLWGKNLKQVALALGFGSLYNHSYEPNATYIKKTEGRMIDFVAIRDIKKDEEITVNYNFGDPTNTKPLWIKSIKPLPQKKI